MPLQQFPTGSSVLEMTTCSGARAQQQSSCPRPRPCSGITVDTEPDCHTHGRGSSVATQTLIRGNQHPETNAGCALTRQPHKVISSLFWRFGPYRSSLQNTTRVKSLSPVELRLGNGLRRNQAHRVGDTEGWWWRWGEGGSLFHLEQRPRKTQLGNLFLTCPQREGRHLSCLHLY